MSTFTEFSIAFFSPLKMRYDQEPFLSACFSVVGSFRIWIYEVMVFVVDVGRSRSVCCDAEALAYVRSAIVLVDCMF